MEATWDIKEEKILLNDSCPSLWYSMELILSPPTLETPTKNSLFWIPLHKCITFLRFQTRPQQQLSTTVQSIATPKSQAAFSLGGKN